MCKYFPARLILLFGAPLVSIPAVGADFPSQLWGRSVVVNSISNGEGPSSAVSFNSQLSVYISGAGRTFSRMTASGAKSTRLDQSAINNPISTALSVYFENGIMVAHAKIAKSAFRIEITFDVAYTKCSATATFENDGDMPTRSKDTGVWGCSVTNGNVLVGR
jgi:hypothetical protein